ncbi:MAG: hypothetical protein JO163_15805 [Methylobacteriaceae bacterium]|nr:hypothetical protein [Methylobacteriaceae bacterium]
MVPSVSGDGFATHGFRQDGLPKLGDKGLAEIEIRVDFRAGSRIVVGLMMNKSRPSALQEIDAGRFLRRCPHIR